MTTIEHTPEWINIIDCFGQAIGVPHDELPALIELLKQANSDKQMERHKLDRKQVT